MWMGGYACGCCEHACMRACVHMTCAYAHVYAHAPPGTAFDLRQTLDAQQIPDSLTPDIRHTTDAS